MPPTTQLLAATSDTGSPQSPHMSAELLAPLPHSLPPSAPPLPHSLPPSAPPRIAFEARLVSIIVSKASTPFDYEISGPAIELAVETVSRLYPHIRFSHVYRNGSNQCTPNVAGFLAAEEYCRHRVTAFIGPGCSDALMSLGG